MAGQSGYTGYVKIGSTNVAEVTKWSFKPTSNNPSWASSTVPGYKRRVAGVKDGGGTIDVKFDRTSMFISVLDVGTEVTLLLYPEVHTTGTVVDSKFYSVPAIVDSYSIEVDIDGGDVTGASIEFSTNGAWTNMT
jgi:hypothetical protein